MTIWHEADQLDLTAILQTGDAIVLAQGPSQPLTLCETLVRQKQSLTPLSVFFGGLFSNTFPPETTDGIEFSGYGVIGQGGSALSKAGRLNVIPAVYSMVPRLYAEGTLRADVVFIQMSPAIDGQMSIGLTNDFAVDAARKARVVIAEVNDQVPWIYGAQCPADLRIDHAIRVSRPPVGLAGSSTLGKVEQTIADYVAALIPDGTTIQIGIGAIPEAILSALSNHRDLGVHSGLIGDRIADLMEAGVITNAKKPIDTGKTVTNVVLGTKRVNDFVHRNSAVLMPHSSYCHAPQTLAALDRFYTINSGIEVDLTGQVNAEMADGVYVGAAGGQPDFVRGALLAERGRSLIVLPSTARRGTRSRIVARLNEGIVTTPRCDADLVVTEWGVADLRGIGFAERRRRMIAIADPAFREDLERAVREGQA